MAKPDKPTLVDGIKVEVTADAFDDFEVLQSASQTSTTRTRTTARRPPQR